MKILYIENIRLPTEKAHGIQIMKMCEAFARAGHKVVLVVPNRLNNIKEDPFDFYNTKPIFEIKKIWVPNILYLKSLGFWVQTFIFSELSSFYIRKYKPDIIYSRDERILINYIFIFKNLVWEAHRGTWNIFIKLLIVFLKKIVLISNGLKKFYSSKVPRYASKTVVSPDGVDLDFINVAETREDSREKLHLPLDKKIVLYTGHLYKWKGVYTLADAAKLLDSNILVVFVGGTEHDVLIFKNYVKDTKNCIVLGQKRHIDIPLYLKSADLLVLPNGASDMLGSSYTSPLKLFEYMASGVPILASSVPAIREILNENNSIQFIPDSPADLSKKINHALFDNKETKKLSENAKREVLKYTWDERVRSIIKSLES